MLAACFPPESFHHDYDDREVVLFNGALQHHRRAPPAPRCSQRGAFLEGKFFGAKRRRKPEGGEMKGKYIPIWSSGMTESETTEVNREGEVQPIA